MSTSGSAETVKVGIAQISPVWLNRDKTLDKIIKYVESAAKVDCRLVVFGEALLPGYPFWVELTDGARFNSPLQKEIHAHYMTNAVQKERPDILANGGSCIAGPDGEWIVEPMVGEEKLVVANLDHRFVLRERQNFDPAGHYARPDVTQLTLNRQRQSTLNIVD